ncbi:MAG: hypothetical protein Q9197_003471 [Variospora fuerteventurae]
MGATSKALDVDKKRSKRLVLLLPDRPMESSTDCWAPADQFLTKQDDYQWRIRYVHGAPQEGFDKFSASDAAYVNGTNKEDKNLLIVVTSNQSYDGQVGNLFPGSSRMKGVTSTIQWGVIVVDEAHKCIGDNVMGL